MKQLILIFGTLLISSVVGAQTYVTVSADHARISSNEFEDADIDGWAAGIDLSHWFDNEVFVNVAGGINKSSLSECTSEFCVSSDADSTGMSVDVGKRFNNITPFIRARFDRVETSFSSDSLTFTESDSEWDFGIGVLIEVGAMIYGVTADALKDADEGFELSGEITFKVTDDDGITLRIGRAVNVVNIESTRFGIGWVRFF